MSPFALLNFIFGDLHENMWFQVSTYPFVTPKPVIFSWRVVVCRPNYIIVGGRISKCIGATKLRLLD